MIAALLRSGLVLGLVNAGWSSLLSFLAIPIYLRHFGVESYGLVGFAATLQGVLGLLDLGLTPAINREVARHRAIGDFRGAAEAVHSLSWVFWPVSMVTGTIVALAAPAIAHHWLKSGTLPDATITTCVMLMGLTFAVRLPGSVYNNALLGAGRLNLVSAVSMLTGTLSTGGAVVLILLGDIDIVGLFVWQGLVSVGIVMTLIASVMVVIGRSGTILPSIEPLRRVWRFSVGMGVTAVIGVAFNYVDRLVLSGLVSLKAFGGYSLALAIARLVTLIVGPTQQFLYPRFTTMHAGEDAAALRQVYYSWACILACALFSLGVFLTFYAGPVVLVISGNVALSRSLPLVVSCLVWGTVLNGIMYFPGTLQMAFGRSRLAAGIAVGLLAFYVPVFIVSVRLFGMRGAAATWFVVNLANLFAGTWLTHRKLLAETPWRWLSNSLGVPFLYALTVGAGVWLVTRAAGGSAIVTIGAGAIGIPLTFLLFVGTSKTARSVVFQARAR